MTDTTTPAAVRLTATDQDAADWVATVRGALREGSAVHFLLVDDGSAPWFSLRSFGDAVRVFDGAGGHLGTFGSVEAAVARGWERGGWGG